MPGEDIQSWSKTAASNGNADTLINWLEGQTRASVNNSARGMMAAIAKDRDLHNGSIVTAGTANAQTFLSGVTYTVIPTGLIVRLKIGPLLTNTGAATLAMDFLAGVAIKDQTGADIAANALVAGAYADFLWNGTNWILLSKIAATVAVQVFTVSGTYTPATGMSYCIIECIGAGGAGGGVGGNSTYVLGGGGGGAGGYSRKRATAVEIGVSQVVTIGAGGTGGTGNGNSGGTTSLGALCVANGGSGGTGATISNAGPGGSGATAGTGNVAATGATGLAGVYWAAAPAGFGPPAGAGGNSYYGGGGAAGLGTPTGSAANGGAAAGYGAGGGGASANNAGNNANGGNGSSGLVIITEFIGL